MKAIVAPTDMEEIRNTYPIVILRGKGRGILSCNLLLRLDAYDTIRTRDVLPLQEINTYKRQIKIQRMVRTTKTPEENDECRHNSDLS